MRVHTNVYTVSLMSNTDRLAKAETVAAAIVAILGADKSCSWRANAWQGGPGLTRVYVTRNNKDLGYLVIDDDGDVTGANKVDHRAVSALDRAGIESFA